MAEQGLSVGVVGGGIGGLAAALSLLREGFDVHVYEQAAALSEVGAGDPGSQVIVGQSSTDDEVSSYHYFADARWLRGPSDATGPRARERWCHRAGFLSEETNVDAAYTVDKRAARNVLDTARLDRRPGDWFDIELDGLRNVVLELELQGRSVLRIPRIHAKNGQLNSFSRPSKIVGRVAITGLRRQNKHSLSVSIIGRTGSHGALATCGRGSTGVPVRCTDSSGRGDLRPEWCNGGAKWVSAVVRRGEAVA